eukprot:TRINITY_DN1393_c2_g1_i1.p1 TRINITY_DN1393_c2_g1~~TRINITY_DN1393_c2_g1_i1.p1  ORF type:complete len:204 (+),score=25.33 TRINITY_DN1393_c2_g1_i1:110-721(+)
MSSLTPIGTTAIRYLGRLGSSSVLIPKNCDRLVRKASELETKWKHKRVEELRKINVQVSGKSIVPLAFVDSSHSLNSNNKELTLYGVPVVHLFLRSWVLQTLNGYNHKDVNNVLSMLLNPGILTFAYTGLELSRGYLSSAELEDKIRAGFASGEATLEIEAFFSTQLYALTGGIYLELGLPAAFDFLSENIAPSLVESLQDSE